MCKLPADKYIKQLVRRNMQWLVQNINPMVHVDYLYSKLVLNEEDYQNIHIERTTVGGVSNYRVR